MSNDGALLLSIRPQYASRIVGGFKTAELRRQRPQAVAPGDVAFIYFSGRERCLAAAFEIEAVVTDDPRRLWTKVGDRSDLGRDEFFDYYKSAERGTAILIARAWLLPSPIDLRQLRKILPGFHPPQIYRYLAQHECAKIAG